MQKSKLPTSRYQLFCDTFDTKLEAKIHEVNGIQKLLISISSVDDEKDSKSISIYFEEVEMLSKFTDGIKQFIDVR